MDSAETAISNAAKKAGGAAKTGLQEAGRMISNAPGYVGEGTRWAFWHALGGLVGAGIGRYASRKYLMSREEKGWLDKNLNRIATVLGGVGGVLYPKTVIVGTAGALLLVKLVWPNRKSIAKGAGLVKEEIGKRKK